MEITENTNCFFWLFDPRFDALLEDYLAYRTNVLCGPQCPITVRAYDCQVKTPGRLLRIGRSADTEIFQEEPEDVNAAFSKMVSGWEFYKALSIHQSEIDLVSFTNEHLQPQPGLKVFGAGSSIAEPLNSKTYQYNLFEQIGVPQPRSMVLSNFDALNRECSQILTGLSEFVLKPAFSAGGWKTAVISHPRDLEAYKNAIPEIDLARPFLVSEFIQAPMSPAVLGSITPDGRVQVLGVVDQIVRDFSFLGDIYPSFLSKEQQLELVDIARRIGVEMVSQGYWGFFGVDFVMDREGRFFVTEVNARFTFGVLILLQALKENLFEIMLKGLEDGGRPLPQPSCSNERLLITKIPVVRAGDGSKAIQNPAEQPLSEEIKIFWPSGVSVCHGSYRGLATAKFTLSTEYKILVDYVDSLKGVP